MQNKHGDFVWYELLTPDANAAEAFYGPLLGWEFVDSKMPGISYHLVSAADVDGDGRHEVAGVMTLTPEMVEGGARPVWLGYIGVDDVDSTVASIQASGGQLLMPAQDIPGVGRIAMVGDPDGVPFYVMTAADDTPSYAFAADKPRPGHCAWNELNATNQAGAWQFYQKHFGWQKDGEMDMGDMGTYDFIRHGGMIGAIMQKTPDMPMPTWSYYFRVTDIDAAVEHVKTAGGQLMHGPQEVPGGDHIIVGADPQGAIFCLVGGRSAA
ncbi:MAG TPA: VOC family protein [Pseudohongiella sp.]|nr:VOC family protein [Pseudohongiella sp.]